MAEDPFVTVISSARYRIELVSEGVNEWVFEISAEFVFRSSRVGKPGTLVAPKPD